MVARLFLALAVLAGATATPAVAQPPMQGVTIRSPRTDGATLAPLTPFGTAFGCEWVGIEIYWQGVLIESGYDAVTPNTGVWIYESTNTAAGMTVDIRVYTPLGASAWVTNVTINNS
jgi:hypothetical protein